VVSIYLVAGESSAAQFTCLDDDGLVVIWDLQTGKLLQEVHVPFNGPIVTCCWIPVEQGDGEAFAFGCADGSLHVYTRNAPEVSRF
jgi:WD40 repeat protein